MSEFIPCINCSGVPRSATRAARSSVVFGLVSVEFGACASLSSSCSSSAITSPAKGSTIESTAVVVVLLLGVIVGRGGIEVFSISSSESEPKRASSVFLLCSVISSLQVDVLVELLRLLVLLLLLLSLSVPLLLLAERLLVSRRRGCFSGVVVFLAAAGRVIVAGRVSRFFWQFYH